MNESAEYGARRRRTQFTEVYSRTLSFFSFALLSLFAVKHVLSGINTENILFCLHFNCLTTTRFLLTVKRLKFDEWTNKNSLHLFSLFVSIRSYSLAHAHFDRSSKIFSFAFWLFDRSVGFSSCCATESMIFESIFLFLRTCAVDHNSRFFAHFLVDRRTVRITLASTRAPRSDVSVNCFQWRRHAASAF